MQHPFPIGITVLSGRNGKPVVQPMNNQPRTSFSSRSTRNKREEEMSKRYKKLTGLGPANDLVRLRNEPFIIFSLKHDVIVRKYAYCVQRKEKTTTTAN